MAMGFFVVLLVLIVALAVAAYFAMRNPQIRAKVEQNKCYQDAMKAVQNNKFYQDAVKKVDGVLHAEKPKTEQVTEPKPTPVCSAPVGSLPEVFRIEPSAAT